MRSESFHEDPPVFRTAIGFTEAKTGFSGQLIEKDYYCSLILRDLAGFFAKASPDLSDARIAILQGQIETQLRPVLRARDYEDFDLFQVIDRLQEMLTRLRK